jgi:hypothetical protein
MGDIAIIYGLVDPRDRQLRYIGLSKNGMRRPREHSKGWSLREDGNTHKANWIRQLLSTGAQPEVVVIQSFDDPAILPEAEMHWIAYFKKMGYKLTNGTAGGDGNLNPTAGVRLKMSSALRGRKLSPESIAKREATRGPHVVSPETRVRMSVTHTIANAHLQRPVVDQDGNRYSGVSTAARQLGIPAGNIVAVLKGRRSHAGGRVFTYAS